MTGTKRAYLSLEIDIEKIKEMDNTKLVEMLRTLTMWEQIASQEKDDSYYGFQTLSHKVQHEIINRMK